MLFTSPSKHNAGQRTADHDIHRREAAQSDEHKRGDCQRNVPPCLDVGFRKLDHAGDDQRADRNTDSRKGMLHPDDIHEICKHRGDYHNDDDRRRDDAQRSDDSSDDSLLLVPYERRRVHRDNARRALANGKIVQNFLLRRPLMLGDDFPFQHG